MFDNNLRLFLPITLLSTICRTRLALSLSSKKTHGKLGSINRATLRLFKPSR